MKKVLIFGASGQIGRNLIRKLTQNNYRVTAITRNLHAKGYILKTQGNSGYIEVVETNVFDVERLNELIKNSDICINLIGILFEKKRNTFRNIHTNLPDILSQLCSEHNLEQFIHVSALGIEKAHNSEYAISKLDGEMILKKNFSKSTILKPSLIYSVDDKFTTSFMSLFNITPVLPLYYFGNTKFTPLHVSDMSEIIYQVVAKKINSKIIECIGPEQITFKKIIEKLLKSVNKKRLLLPTPLFIGKITAKLMETFMSNPLITVDQLKLLKYDNIPSGNYETNFDLNLQANLKFDEEINKYAYTWREAGEFAREIDK